MTLPKDWKLDVEQQLSGTRGQELQDRLDHLLYQKTCEIIQDPGLLSKILQSLPANTNTVASPPASDKELAELVIADDAENLGRLIIDQVINIAWAMAENELGVSVSENPDVTPRPAGNTH